MEGDLRHSTKVGIRDPDLYDQPDLLSCPVCRRPLARRHTANRTEKVGDPRDLIRRSEGTDRPCPLQTALAQVVYQGLGPLSHPIQNRHGMSTCQRMLKHDLPERVNISRSWIDLPKKVIGEIRNPTIHIDIDRYR